VFSVTEKTINTWKRAHPEFAAALARAKDVADDRVERALYERAIGYSHPAVKMLQHEGKPSSCPSRRCTRRTRSPASSG
jgi:hypothetical protein